MLKKPLIIITIFTESGKYVSYKWKKKYRAFDRFDILKDRVPPLTEQEGLIVKKVKYTYSCGKLNRCPKTSQKINSNCPD